MVKWHGKTDVNGQELRGDFRSVTWLYQLEKKAKRKYGAHVYLRVFQQDYNRTVAASAGTHNLSSVWDVQLVGVGWWEAQKFIRANGGMFWYRWAVTGLWIDHLHGACLPPHTKNVNRGFLAAGLKVGKYIDGGWSVFKQLVTSSQISDYYQKKNGLAGHGADKGWHPADHGGVAATIYDLDAFCRRQAILQDRAA